MRIQQALDTALRADTTLMNYLGGAVAPTTTTGRLYWLKAMQGALCPHVVYTGVSDIDEAAHFGRTDSGWGRFQFDTVTLENGRANGLAIDDRIRTLLRYVSGTVGGLTVRCIYPILRRERYDEEAGRCIFSADYEVQCDY